MGFATTMISWNFWRALQIPYVAHPIYRLRGVWEPPASTSFNTRFPAPFQIRPMLLVMFSIALVTAIPVLWGFPVLFVLVCGPALILVAIVIPATLVLVGTVYGLAVTLAVSDTIFIEKAQGRYALMTLTPRGLAGATWALSSLIFHTNALLTQIRRWLVTIYVSAGMTILLVLYPVLLVVPGTISKALVWLAVFAAFFCDYIQSTNTGCLLGMIIPSFSQSRATTRSYAIAAFLTLQFGCYLIILFLCVVLWPTLHLSSVQQQLRFTLVSFVTYVLCREIATIMLLVTLARRLNTTLDEWDEIAHIGTRWISRPLDIPLTLIQSIKRGKP